MPVRAEIEQKYAALMIEGQFNVTNESLVHAQVIQPLLEFTALVALQLAIAQLFECINHLLCCKLALVKDDHLRSGGSRRFDKKLVIRIFIAVPVDRRRGFEHSRVTVENR